MVHSRPRPRHSLVGSLRSPGCCSRQGLGPGSPAGAEYPRQPSPRTAAFRSPPGIHPLSVQPKAQVSSLRKAAVPRAIEQMGRSRARMGDPQPGSPTGRTGGVPPDQSAAPRLSGGQTDSRLWPCRLLKGNYIPNCAVHNLDTGCGPVSRCLKSLTLGI